MAQPFAVDGAMKSAERPLSRVATDFFTPSTSASVLIRTQRRTFVSSPWISGTSQCESIGTISASGHRATISCPRGSASAASSA
ncbi:hypothetical protein QE367_001697 [Microbacterium paludicola]|uniref:Uncharacterized protein n=1 Tax=Microbacterium paludicola TaxID=300019 RepID=A0ABU1I2X4_9MICO|nr:hypothetical protein [Microbacterium paludicola]MDR6167493.1 hypothetical protein [Microbacterium paludicola]